MRSFVLVSLLAGAFAAQAQITTFRVVAGAYGTATNWSPAVVPQTNDTARIAITNIQNVTHASNTFSAGSLQLGAGASTGSLSVSGGKLTYGGLSYIASNGSVANLIIAGGGVAFTGNVIVGYSVNANATGAITNNTGTLTVDGDLNLGLQNGSGVNRGYLTVNGGSVAVSNIVTANGGGHTRVDLNGGTLDTFGFRHTGSASVRELRLNGGTLRARGDNTNFLPIAANAVAFTVLVQNAHARIDTQAFTVDSPVGFLRDGASTGALIKAGSGVLQLRAGNTFVGGLVVSAGTVRVATGGTLANNAANGITVQSGATFALSNVNAFVTTHGTALATPITLNGGTLRGEGKEVRLGNLNLNGGTILLDGGSAAWGTFMIPDTITVGGSSVSIITNTPTLYGDLRPETATVFNVGDVTAGDDLIVYAPLLNRVNSGGPASFTKTGAGSMQLENPANAVGGTVTISAGRLGVGGSSRLPASTVTVASGAVYDVSAFSSLDLTNQTVQGGGTVLGNPKPDAGSRILAGTAGTVGTLTITGSVYVGTATYTNAFDLTNTTTIGSGINDLIEIGGLYEPNGSRFLINPLAPLTTGVYRLINYVGMNSQSFSPVVLGNTYRDAWNVDMTTAGQVNLVVGAGTNQFLLWNGAVSGDWDLGTYNWTNLVQAVTDRFYDVDTVYFDDSGAAVSTVTLTTPVRPQAVTVDSSLDYVFQGAGRIADPFASQPASLLKAGAGALTVRTTNTFGGGTIVSNGTLALGAGATLGTGAIRVAVGTLAAAGATVTVANPVQLDAGTIIVDDTGNQFALSGPVSGAGALLKLGAGTTTVSGVNGYAGGTVISRGVFRQANSNSVGGGTITLGDGGTGASDIAWLFAGGQSPSNKIVVSSSGSGSVRLGSYSSANFTFHSGPVELNRAVTLVDAGTDRTSFTGPISGNPGTITIVGTRVTFSNPTNSFTGQLIVSPGSIYQNDTTTAVPVAVEVVNQGSFRLNNGGTHLLGAMSGTGKVDIVAGAASTLSLGNGNATGTFAGVITNGAFTMSLNKEGTGTITLTGPNTFNGNVTMNGGVLALGVGGSISNVGTIFVNTGGTFDVSAAGLVLRPGQTLRGGGTVAGPVLATATSRVVAGSGGPGGTRETLTFTGSLGLHPSSTNFFNLGSTTNIGAPYNDHIVVAGNLDPSGSVIRIDVEEPLATGTYRLMTYGGAKPSSFNPVVDLSQSVGRRTATVDESITGQINLNIAGSSADLVWLPQVSTNWNFTDANWSNTASAALDTFYQGDSVLFDERGAVSNIVLLTTTSQPSVVTVAGTSNFTFLGTGRVQGLGSLVKSGTGLLAIYSTNTYTGGTRIDGGTLRMGNASALGATTGYLLVTNGGTLDINGIDSAYTVNIAGTGLGGQGAAVNNGAAIQTGPDIINLTGDAAIGGTNRWDIRGVATRLNLNGFTLSKVGPNYIPLVQGTANSGTVEIVSGGLGVEAAAVFTQGQVNVRSGGYLGLYNNSTFTTPITIFGGRLNVWNGSASVTLSAPIALSNAPATFTPDGGDNLFITNVISGTVGFIVDATTGGGVELAGENTFTGDIVVSNGYLTIGRGGTSGSVGGNVTLVNGSTQYLWRSDALTLSNTISGVGSVFIRNPSGLTIDGRASIQVSGDVRIPWDGFNTYVRIDTGALLSAGNVYLGNTSGWSGSITQHAGTVRASNVLGVGQWNNETSRYFLAGGTISVTNGRFSIGWDGLGIFIQTGGVVNARRAQVDANNSTAGASLWIMEGGVFNVIDSLDGMGDAADLALWGGGTIGALGNFSAAPGFRAILTGTNGNTTLDTAAYTVTLTGSVFTGVGGLSKAGAGTLVLTGGGSNQYTGGTALNNGSLLVNNQLVADVNVAALATLAGTGSVLGVATVSSNGVIQPGLPTLAAPLSVTSVVLQANAKVNPIVLGTAAVLRVTGTNGLTVPAGAATAQINILNIGLTVGTYTLIDYAGTIQGGTETNLVLGSYAPGSVMYLTNNTANTSIDLVIVSLGGAVKWTGLVDANWNINTTTNWQTELGLLPAGYADDGTLGNSVVFDDTAAGNFAVNVTVPVQPVSIRVANTNNDYTIAGNFPIGGPGGLTKSGPGGLTINTTNSFAGRTAVDGGSLTIAAAASLGQAPLAFVSNQLSLANGTTLRTTGDVALESTRGILLGSAGTAGDVTIDTGSKLVTIPTALVQTAGGTNGLTKRGTGVLTLQGLNTFGGATTVEEGALVLTANSGGTGAIGNTLNIRSGASVTCTAANALGYTGTAWVRTLNISNGTFVTTGNGDQGWGLTVNMVGGTMVSTGTGARFSAGSGFIVNTFAAPASARIGGQLNTRESNTNNVLSFNVAEGPAAVDLLVDAIVTQQTASVGIQKRGDGLMSLSATNNYSGNTIVEGGTLRVEDSGKLYHAAYQASAVVTVRSNALLDLATWAYSEPGAESLGGLRANNNAIVIDGGTIRVRKSSSYYRGFTIGAAGATFEAVTGTVWTIGFDATTPIVNTTGGSLTLQGAGAGVFQKTFFGTGTLVKAGSGLWTLSGTNTHGGPTMVSNGTLAIEGVNGTNLLTVAAGATLRGAGVAGGDVTADGVVAPGAATGTLTIGRAFTMSTGATLRIELGGTAMGSTYDLLMVSNTATLSGALEVALTGGFIPGTGDVFHILSAPSVVGTFNTASLPPLPAGQGWVVDYPGSEVMLSITSAPPVSGYDLAITVVTNGLSGYGDDADGDGYANLLEYATGANLTNADTLARMVGGRTNGLLALRFQRATNAVDVTLLVEGSFTATNGADWIGIATNIGGSWGGATNVTETGLGTPVNVAVEDTQPAATNRFLRLRVTRP